MDYLPNVLIFGHSFIKRIERKTRTNPDTFKSDFGLKQCNVTLIGHGGLNFGLRDPRKERQFYNIVDNIFRCNAFDIVVCQLGGNDISYGTSPDALKDAVISLAKYVRTNYNVKVFYVCSIFTRPNPRTIPAEYYEAFRAQANALIKEHSETSDTIVFWPHKRLFHSPQYIFGEDGTHLNDYGNKKFYKSLRQAIIFSVERYRA
ncbi:MAG: SGNH/GDSL hydrolase family protein [Candidatus Thiodiazotropha sp.]